MSIYFVDSEGGNNCNSGCTPDQAFADFEKINKKTFSAGDTIMLKKGSIFHDHLVINGSGEEFVPIRITSYGEALGKPRIEVQDGSKYAVLLAGAYIHMTDIEVTNPTGKQGILIDSHLTGAVCGITVSGCYVHDVWTVNDLGPRHIPAQGWEHDFGGIVADTTYAEEPTWYENLQIIHNTVENVNRSGIWIAGRWSNRFRNSCSWMKNKADGMEDAWYPNKNVSVSWNLVDHAYGDGIVVCGAEHVAMEYNRVYYANCMSRAGASNVGLWTINCNDVMVQYNEVAYTGHEYGGDGEGYDIDLCTINNVFQYNYSHDNEGGFMLVCNGCTNPESMHHNIIRNNISVNDACKKDLPVITISSAMHHIYFVNNTIYVDHDYRFKWIQFCDYLNMGIPKDIYFVNNLFYAKNDDNYYNFEAAGNVMFDNNVFYHAHPLPTWSNVGQKNNFYEHPVLCAEDEKAGSRLAVKGFTPEWNSPLLRLGKHTEQCADKDYFGTDTRGHQYVGAIYYEDLDK